MLFHFIRVEARVIIEVIGEDITACEIGSPNDIKLAILLLFAVCPVRNIDLPVGA
jgi:hypothetical protein